MRTPTTLLLSSLLLGCASNYSPPTTGPTVTLKVESDAQRGVPLISTSHLTLTMYQVIVGQTGDPDRVSRVSLGWQEIRSEGEELILPADKPLDLMLTYRSNQLFGPSLAGSQRYLLRPEPGASYVMTFWTDKQHFSVDVFEQSPAGERVPANVTRLEI